MVNRKMAGGKNWEGHCAKNSGVPVVLKELDVVIKLFFLQPTPYCFYSPIS